MSVCIGVVNGTNFTGTFCNSSTNLAYVALFADLNTAQSFGNLCGGNGGNVISCFQLAQVNQCLTRVFANGNASVCQCDAGSLFDVFKTGNLCFGIFCFDNSNLIVYNIGTFIIQNQLVFVLQSIHLLLSCREENITFKTFFNLGQQST